MRNVQNIPCVFFVFFAPPTFVLLLRRYSDVKYEIQSGESSLDLGLLDFGAAYTVVVINVRKPPAPNFDADTAALRDGTSLTCVLCVFTQESGTIRPNVMVDVNANNVHIAWQIPQYALMTMGEVLFSITGLEFSYSQVTNSPFFLLFLITQ